MLDIQNEPSDAPLPSPAAGEAIPPPPPESSTMFGKYELGKLLGCGAFAKVYHARNVRTGQSVAIKAISKKKVVKSGLTAHVKREISIMRRLRHPHIVKLFEVLATKTKVYFVMEFAKGGELFTKVAKGGRLSEDLSRRCFRQLISAVGYCHSRGVFHRDLKPENLLLDENGDLKVSDFGLSAVTSEHQTLSAAAAAGGRGGDGLLLRTLCGTPAYVAPEILANKGYRGAKVDVWSCGVVLYVLSVGYLPFNDQNLMEMYRKIYRGQFRCPKWTSPDLQRFLSRLLDPNPDTRITVDEIVRDPWFCRGAGEIKFFPDDDLLDPKPGESRKFWNAFDIISLSPGFDLSGLFEDPEARSSSERFVAEGPPERIMGRIEEIAKAERVTVARKGERWLTLRGGNCDGVGAAVQIYRLTDRLCVVEMKGTSRGDESGPDFWNGKVRPKLSSLIYRPEVPVPDA